MPIDKILLVDDEPLFLSTWSHLLETEGYEVIKAENGEEALSKVEHQIPDLAIVDVRLPGISGVEVCKKLKDSSSTSSILVMLVTGAMVSSLDQAAGLNAGADDFVLRPIENRHLLARVRSLFRVIHTRNELQEAHDKLEMRVQEQISEYEKINRTLREEIDSRRIIEEKLSMTLQRLKLHVENTPLGVVEFNEQYQITSWSKSAEKIFGWTADEVIGKTINDFPWVVDEDKKDVADLSYDMSKGEKTSNLNINRNYRKDGTIIICEWHNSALTDANGKMISVLSFVQDITEEKNAERQLWESRSRLDLALKGANQGAWDWNIKTGELIVNERWAEILGFTLYDVTPYSVDQWTKICHPDDMKERDEALKRHLAGETENYVSEMRLQHTNGEWLWIRARGKVMEWDRLGSPVRASGTIVDITDEKKNQNERNRLIAELQEALANVKTLSGLIPICSSCKKIRDDKGYWNVLEQYLIDHSDAKFSHGVCPDCLKRDFPAAYEKMYGNSK